MNNYRYEIHALNNKLLPFIYHHQFKITERSGLPNWHENIELLQCTEGSGYVQCGTQVFAFSCGDIFVINANTPHCVCSENTVIYNCLIVDNSFSTENGIPIEVIHFKNTIRDVILNDLFCTVDTAFQSYDDAAIYSILDIRCAVLELLRYLCKHYAMESPNESISVSSKYVKQAMEYIRKNIVCDITLDDIAADVGISKYYLSREFRSFTGKTIVQTINLMRCTEARHLIENGSSVSSAAISCGFKNISYFTNTFKKIFGILPSDCADKKDYPKLTKYWYEQVDPCY